MNNYTIQVYSKKNVLFSLKMLLVCNIFKKIMEMLIYVIQIKKNGNSGVDNEEDHVDNLNTERVINTQVNNTNLYYL